MWTLRYILINVTYFAVYSGLHAYAAVFLADKGFSSTWIGITLALANILSVILQPLIAGIIDKQGKLTNRNTAMMSTLFLIAGAVILLAFKTNFILIFIVFALMYMVQMVYQPVLIAMFFEYEKAGCNIFFGLARGLGSAGFAVSSFFIGSLVKERGVNVLMIFNIIVLSIAFVVLWFFRKPATAVVIEEKSEGKAHNNIFEFIKTYPMFMLFVAGAVCFFFAHNAINDFLINIITPLGGNEESMGYAVSLAAFLELPTMALINIIMKKISAKKLLILSGFFFGIKTLIMLLAVNMTMVYISQAFQMFAYAVFIPVSAYYVNRIMDKYDQVKGQAYVNCAITLGGVFSNLVCGRILDLKGPGSMLVLSMIVTSVGFAAAFFALNREKRTQNAQKT